MVGEIRLPELQLDLLKPSPSPMLQLRESGLSYIARNITIVSFLCSYYFQIVIDEGQKVGSSFQGDMTRAGKVKVGSNSVIYLGKNTQQINELY